MKEDSHTDKVITGSARTLVKYASAGLFIIGDGPLRDELEEQVENLSLKEKVFFLGNMEDVLSCMKTADLLIHLSEDSEEELVTIQAAAVGLPMLIGTEGNPSGLFVENESAYVCPNDSPICVSEKVTRFLNDNTIRVLFSQNAKARVFNRIEQDYGAYLKVYRASIERCVVKKS